MSLLPVAPLVRYYNGVNFGFAECETLEAEAVPVLASCGRHVMAVTHTLTVRCIVGQANQLLGTTTDSDMSQIRARLTAVGKEFHWESVGYGPLAVQVPAAGPSIGAPSVLKDVMWGPRPQVLKWKPMGQQAAEVDWRVSVTIACEPDGPQVQQGFLQWCWRWATGIDQSGYTTRRWTGFIQVAGILDPDNPRTLTDQADRLREQVTPYVMPGFKRTTQNFDLDEAKTRLNFEFVDVESGPNYPEAGAVGAQASHELASHMPATSVRWKGVLSARYELSRERSLAQAESMFWRLADDRVRGAIGKPFRAADGEQRSSVLFRAYSIGEPDIYGKPVATFRLEYTLLTSLEELAETSGIWRPVKNGDWATWAQSLSGSAFAPRGNAGLRFDTSADAIINLCQQAAPPRRTTGRPPGTPPRGTPDKPKNDVPDPAGSWLLYLCLIHLERIDETIELKPLPPQRGGRPQLDGAGRQPSLGRLATATQAGGGQAQPPRMASLATARQAREAATPPLPPPPPPPPGDPRRREPAEEPTVQRRAAPTWHAWLYGMALRAGWECDAPELVSVAGFPVVAANLEGCGVSKGRLADFLGVPVFYCTWNLRYLILGDFGGVAPAPAAPAGA